MPTYTLTFGDCAENHVGMQKIGNILDHGLSVNELKNYEKYFRENGLTTELIELNRFADVNEDDAYLLVIRNAVNFILNRNDGTDLLLNEQERLEYDKKAFMRGEVKNKNARHNICFGEINQQPNYEEKKGTIVSFYDVFYLDECRRFISEITGITNLQCEGNHYYNIKNTYIGFHGDTERKVVVAIRLGESFPLHYRWYQNSNAIGEQFSIMLNSGDMYFMSEKAVGTDWKKRKIATLRHAAGFKVPNLDEMIIKKERRFTRYNRVTAEYDVFYL